MVKKWTTIDTVRNCFILFLLISFLYLLAWPCFDRYIKGGIFIEEGRRQQDHSQAPAITFCAMQRMLFWKKNSTQVNGHTIATNCNVSTDARDILDCIEATTFSLNETIKGGFHGMIQRNPIANISFWRSTMGSKGNCHTFLYPYPLTSADVNGIVFFQLDPTLDYMVDIHDPNYNAITANPIIFPRIFKQFHKLEKGHFEFIYIKQNEHKLLNRKDQQCEDSIPDYNYLRCIQNRKARLVGCRPGWDEWADSKLKLCTSLSQFSKHEQLDFSLFRVDQKTLYNTTGCKIPCSYTEFVVVGETMKGTTNHWMGNNDRFTLFLSYAYL